jgi:protoporphyrinogen IX oxidase
MYLKALHLIFVVTWFAGLFYIVRLFIYHVEAFDKSELEKQVLIPQYKLMEKRLWYGITWPSAILTLLFGGSLLYQNDYLLKLPFMHIKLTFLLGLYIYQIICHQIFKKLQNDIPTKWTSNKLRIWNEVATLFLFSIIFVIVLKNSFNWIYGVVGLILFSVILMLAIKVYKKIRNNNNE